MTAPLDMAAGTDRGRLRLHNEDCLAAIAESGFAVLADGMGGHNAGEVASRMAVEVISSGIEAVVRAGGAEHLDSAGAELLITERIAHANARIYEAGHSRREYAGMGTTIVVALWRNATVTIGHIGDSRMYRMRAGELKQLTHDHSLAQEHVDRGILSADEARIASIRNILTRTVGNALQVTAELNSFDVVADDLYLLCSDGLTDMLTDEQIGQAMISFGAEVQQAVDQLIQQANDQGGADNVSVILVRVVSALERGRGE